ncbi:mucoidy inhibitor MuiA family protein [Jiulongibacter sediminis]|uniref:Mucoidy inhibitor MuiA family protein n=1 Tax=Jiulongibacter sediminis TaxID=1605367 RepID=A0A0P7BUS6_9BACT|nr:mucoidy inhibitor MuiA family protein [Jiulongibacter sediminis]KPM48584.1 hypothetical protein AFM12_08205 [Jiulongibacter sediminis]TBX25122.1 hypothetical protein TK44_08210 [Jiulongibacter sediminis]
MKYFQLLLLVSFSAIGQKQIDSQVTKINIYPSGAQVFRSLKTDLTIGTNQLVIRGISNEISSESIQVNLSDHSLSVSDLIYQSSFLSAPETQKRNTEIKKEVRQIIEQKSQLNIDLTVLSREEQLLLSNQKVGGTYSGMKPEDLKNTVDFFKTRMQEILNKKASISKSLEVFDNQIRNLNKELNELMNEEKNQLSEILFTVKSSNALKNKEIEISYFTPNAGWAPTYDIKANSFDLPLQILYKADVYQYTGENWKDVSLTFNNLMPNAKANVPEIRPWVWGFPNSYELGEELAYNKSDWQITGFVVDERTNEPLPGVSIQLRETTLGTSTDVNGFYSLTIPPDRRKKDNFLSYSFIGFNSLTLNSKEVPSTVKLNEDTQALEEVVVTGYSVQRKKTTSFSEVLSGKAKGVTINTRQELKKLVAEEEGPTSLQFTLTEKTSLESSGKARSIELKELQIPATFEHISVPKIDQSVYVNASITDWGALNLLPGKASIYAEGTFLGTIDLELPSSDTLNISLGKDPGVFITRKLLKSFARNKILGSSVEESFNFEILIRNTKDSEINFKLIDQFPLSGNKEVEITEMEAKGANIDETSGRVIWNEKVSPNLNKTFKIGYKVKYPKSGYISE